MANDVAGNPMVLDTIGSTASLAWIGPAYIENVELTDYTADTDTAILKDGTGRVVASLNGAADLSTCRTGKVGWIQSGFFLSTLSAGKLRIYIK